MFWYYLFEAFRTKSPVLPTTAVHLGGSTVVALYSVITAGPVTGRLAKLDLCQTSDFIHLPLNQSRDDAAGSRLFVAPRTANRTVDGRDARKRMVTSSISRSR